MQHILPLLFILAAGLFMTGCEREKCDSGLSIAPLVFSDSNYKSVMTDEIKNGLTVQLLKNGTVAGENLQPQWSDFHDTQTGEKVIILDLDEYGWRSADYDEQYYLLNWSDGSKDTLFIDVREKNTRCLAFEYVSGTINGEQLRSHPVYTNCQYVNKKFQ